MEALRSTFSLERFGVSSPFDPNFHYVTSPVFSPPILGAFRLLFAVSGLTITIVTLVFSSLVFHDSNLYLSYFTDLSFIGLVAYFWASGVQTVAFVIRGRKSYPLQYWPHFLQLLHVLLYSTVVVFPIVVSITYWSLLSAGSFQTPYLAFDAVSHHIINLVFVLFEILFTHARPGPWIHLFPIIIILALYLGLAYVTYATQGVYTYSFLDPATEGGLLGAYIVGIAIGCCVVFSIVKGVCQLRRRLSFRYGRYEDFYSGEELEEWQDGAVPKEPPVSEA